MPAIAAVFTFHCDGTRKKLHDLDAGGASPCGRLGCTVPERRAWRHRICPRPCDRDRARASRAPPAPGARRARLVAAVDRARRGAARLHAGPGRLGDVGRVSRGAAAVPSRAAQHRPGARPGHRPHRRALRPGGAGCRARPGAAGARPGQPRRAARSPVHPHVHGPPHVLAGDLRRAGPGGRHLGGRTAACRQLRRSRRLPRPPGRARPRALHQPALRQLRDVTPDAGPQPPAGACDGSFAGVAAHPAGRRAVAPAQRSAV